MAKGVGEEGMGQLRVRGRLKKPSMIVEEDDESDSSRCRISLSSRKRTETISSSASGSNWAPLLLPTFGLVMLLALRVIHFVCRSNCALALARISSYSGLILLWLMDCHPAPGEEVVPCPANIYRVVSPKAKVLQKATAAVKADPRPGTMTVTRVWLKTRRPTPVPMVAITCAASSADKPMLKIRARESTSTSCMGDTRRRSYNGMGSAPITPAIKAWDTIVDRAYTFLS
mmetsp:Transcript_25023/g.41220  ORF Transcript_25023/g.41220 Transcript_25023/m.41220 type:complete len:230 (+) Transcript_25023:2020-2709(+)